MDYRFLKQALESQPTALGPGGLTEDERQYLQAYEELMAKAQQPLPPPGVGQQIGASLQQMPGPQAAWSPWENLASGFASGLGQGLERKGQQRQQQQALKNQRNMAATQAILSARGKKLGEKTPQQEADAAGLKAGAEQAARNKVGPMPSSEPTVVVPWSGLQVGRDTPLGLHVAGSGTKAQWDRRDYVNQSAGAGADVVPMSPEAIDMYADQLASKGKSSVSMRDIKEQHRIANRAAQKYPGINLSRNEAIFSANKNSLANLTKLHDGVTAFTKTADANVAVFDEYAKKIGGYDSPLANRGLRWWEKNMKGSPEMAAYDAARKTVATEYTRILTTLAGSGQITDNAQKELDAIVRGDYGLKQMREVLDVFRRDALNRDNAYAERIAEITSGIGQVPGATPPAAGAGAGAAPVEKWMRDKSGKLVRQP